MKALLLNSGLGSRMGDLAADCPKTMCPIGLGETILSNQIAALAMAGIKDVVVTTGPFADKLEAYLSALPQAMRYTFVHNPRYAQTNYIYSMHLAAPALLGDEIISLHGDLVMDAEVIAMLAGSGENTMVVDSTLPLPDKDFKARIQGGRVVEIGVQLAGAGLMACQAAYHWTREGFAAWMGEIARFCEKGEVRVYAENAFNALGGSLSLAPLDVRGMLCAEIDHAEDLAVVSQAFLRLRQAYTKP